MNNTQYEVTTRQLKRNRGTMAFVKNAAGKVVAHVTALENGNIHTVTATARTKYYSQAVKDNPEQTWNAAYHAANGIVTRLTVKPGNVY